MQITNDECLNLIVEDDEFQGFFEDPFLQSINISVQYNCCDNTIYEETLLNCIRFRYLDEIEEYPGDLKIILDFELINTRFVDFVDTVEFQTRFDITISTPNVTAEFLPVNDSDFRIIFTFADTPAYEAGFTFDLQVLAHGITGELNSLINSVICMYSAMAEYIITETTEECGDISSENITIDESGQFTIFHNIFSDLSEEQFLDGVYTVTFTFNFSEGGFYTTYNCIFVDCTIGCLVASFMADNLGKEIATNIAMVHFALTEANNCECECENLCRLFEYLWNKISNQQIPLGCGC